MGRKAGLQLAAQQAGKLIMFDVNLLSYAFGLGFILWLLFK